MQSFLLALAFLTILPIPFRDLPPPAVVARSRWWYPVVGLFVGAVLGGWTALTIRFSSPALGAFLVLAVWLVFTGALHIDGFCDLCDGLFGGSTPEERLRILKDPHLGTFGLVGGLLLVLGKWVVLYEFLAQAPARAPWLVGAAAAVARCLVLSMAAGARYPRPEGTGKVLIEATRWPEALFAAGVAAGVAWLALNPFGTSDWGGALLPLAPFVAAWLAIVCLRVLCQRRLGGVTGDCLGAAIESGELVFLLATAFLL
jgi:adenosylcobinamide-GDP ribazoletransferase